jgi:ATP-dependent helicase/DNAse subunit B
MESYRVPLEERMNFERLSASAIKTFYQCPYQFHLHYNLRLPEEGEPHPLTLMGSDS